MRAISPPNILAFLANISAMIISWLPAKLYFIY
jgi:hypothetical protein